MTRGLHEQAESFRTRPLDAYYPVLWVDAMYEKVRFDGCVVSMAIQVVCGVNEEGRREVIAIEPMLEESSTTYHSLFESLKARGLKTSKLIISDAHKGLQKAIVKIFPVLLGNDSLRNILAHVPRKDKERFADQLKLIWMASTIEEARVMAKRLKNLYGTRFPKAIETLEEGLEESLSYYSFPSLDYRKVGSNNLMERLNKETRRRSKVIGIFPNPESFTRLLNIYLLEYTEDWSSGKAYLSQESLQNM